jgi:hypothetical protein
LDLGNVSVLEVTMIKKNMEANLDIRRTGALSKRKQVGAIIVRDR